MKVILLVLDTYTTGDTGFAVRPNCTAKGDIRTAKALPCVDARQRPHGEGLPGKGFFAVRLHHTARQILCRAASSLPSATTRRRAVGVAVRRVRLPCVWHCRAPSLRTHGKVLLFAVRHPTARTAKSQPGTPQAIRNTAFAVRMRTAKLPNGSLPCAYARQRPWGFLIFLLFSLISAV